MADYIVAKKMSTITLTGGRAFFVPAGFTRRNIMTEAIPITGETERDHRDIHEDVDDKLSEIFTVASLLAAMDSDRIFIGQVNATGYLLTRMIGDAKEIANEHYELWKGGAS